MRSIALTMLLSATGIAATPITAEHEVLRGFTPESSKRELEWEARFKAIPQPSLMRDAMKLLAARPHHVGSAYGKQNAEWVRDQFRSYGWQAEIEHFDVLFPTPRERVLEMVAPTRFTANLDETVIDVDPTSGQKDEQLPPYNAYSADGDVTGPLVFVNYGVPADYEELDRRGISVKGAIVIAKYGGSWRGIKPKVAAEHGAIGCIIYSDPGNDGYFGGDVFPRGPMRPSQGVQRGSVADMPTYPGDPMTPGIGATKGAKRLALNKVPTITKIPTLPISYGNAQPLLAALRGPVAPGSWRGGLPLTYRFGPGPAVVHLKVKSNWNTRTLNNVIARIPGTSEADQWIVRGNHHDAWVNGAQDPISGLIAELEEARAIGELVKAGWRPKRTIVYAAWDGEEPGLLGSTEWAETHADELQRKAVAYLNTDSNSRGFLGVDGSHTLEKFINDVARDIEDPETRVSVWKRMQASTIRSGTAEERKEARMREDLRIDALGSGSDYSPFLQHLGIAALNLGYGGEDNGGIYHSAYDDFYWYTHFSDTSFVYGRALAQTVGIAVMRLANADLLPFTFTNLAETARGYAAELAKLRDTRNDQIVEANRSLDEGVFLVVSDPREPTVGPPRRDAPPEFNFAPILNALDSLASASKRYDGAAAGVRTGTLNTARLASVNRRLLQAERALTSSDGLKGRPWYKHLLYAPGFYTGYGVKTMPAAREAIEQGQWKDVDAELARIGAALLREATLVSRLAAELSAGK
ncbi:MAG: transferrin receptor-like dimerization domain-containing protein [Gemmatimonadales bacterium]